MNVANSLDSRFDGDALNGLLIHDHKAYQQLERLKPHLYVMDLNSPRKISGYVGLPGPVAATIGNWINNR